MFNKEKESFTVKPVTESCDCNDNDNDDASQIIFGIIPIMIELYFWMMMLYYLYSIKTKYVKLEQENGDLIESVALNNMKTNRIHKNLDRVEKNFHEFVYDTDTSIQNIEKNTKKIKKKIKKIS
jgi:hypothetical protein